MSGRQWGTDRHSGARDADLLPATVTLSAIGAQWLRACQTADVFE